MTRSESARADLNVTGDLYQDNNSSDLTASSAIAQTNATRAIILTSSALNNKMIDVAHKHRGHHGSHHVATILLASGGFFLFGYVLLEKKLLPRAWWRRALHGGLVDR